eukprot:GHVO01036513.1.p1 GENE.GHVO01036513.1~~GHVO01036513.1.p1  ORF type:complete len:346 (+),score=54.60 GHVO01036513.1:87-1124(+)
MVGHSDLAFRRLVKKYGVDMSYTPMLHAGMFSTEGLYRFQNFESDEFDRPLVAQFSGHDPDKILAALKHIENDIDMVDLNLGCPQDIARRGHYGAYLLEDEDLVISILSQIASGTHVPLSCKIRKVHDIENTVRYARRIQEAGCVALCIHGRTKDQKGDRTGPADWDVIRAVKNALTIPVIANGGIETKADVDRCLEYTGADAVMASEGILENPALFAGVNVCRRKMALQYIQLASETRTSSSLHCIRSHVFKIIDACIDDTGRKTLAESSSVDGIVNFLNGLELSNTSGMATCNNRKEDVGLRTCSMYNEQGHLRWYRRHRTPKLASKVSFMDEGELDLGLFGM